MWSMVRSTSLSQRILFAMAVGILVGCLFPEESQHLKIVANIFLRMVKSIIVPLLFGTLVTGIAGHSDDLKAVGRLALKSIFYFEVVTTLALVIGLAAVNLVQPGVGVSLPASGTPGQELSRKHASVQETIEHIVPSSIVEAAANNDVLQVVFFTLLFAAALTQVKGRPREVVLAACAGLAEVMFKFTGIVMTFAPLGIAAALACTVGRSGWGVLLNLGMLILTFYAAAIFFVAAVLVPIMMALRIPVGKFFQAVREPAILAFSTTSSEAAMPDAIKRMQDFGVPGRIVSFVVPVGYSFNLDGSTLYLALASVFVAQAAEVSLDLGQQMLMMLTLMLTSKGVAGVPRGALVILSGTLLNFNLPLEGIALLLAIDGIMDMIRSAVNVIGNCVASVVMTRWEGHDLA